MKEVLHQKQNGTLKALYVASLEGTFHEIMQLFAILWYLLRQIATDNFGTWAIFALQKTILPS